MKAIHFEEIQRMTHWWLWLVLASIIGLFLYAIYQQLFLGIPFGQNPMTDTGLVVFAIIIAGLVLLALTMRLRTEISEKGVEMTYAPFRIRRFAAWEEIESVKLVRYGFVGYGIRWGSEFGIVYNMKGSNGIAIQLKNGKKYLIGTQQSEAVSSLLIQIASK